MEGKLAVALDVNSIDEAKAILSEIEGNKIIIKIGYHLFIKGGRELIKYIKEKDFELFLDLKFHDIPNTVYNGVSAVKDLGVDYLTIHTLGGKEMLRAAVKAKGNSNLKLLGVTILTSHSPEYMEFIGSKYTIDELAIKLAEVAIDAGVDGIVSSPFEVKKIKSFIKKDFIAVTPGIRLTSEKKDDQTRIATPEFAISEGADILVVGRPIINARNKKEALKEFLRRIKNA